jgi:predicted MPP superfamily phosphohydrolase
MMHWLGMTFGLWTLLHVYVVWRAATVPVIARHVPRWLLIGVAVLLWMGVIVARLADRLGAGIVAGPLELIAWDWIPLLFFLAGMLLVVDVVTLFGFAFRRLVPRLRGWALLAGATLGALAVVQGVRPPVVRSYEVRLAGLPTALDGTVLVAASDFHLGRWVGARWLAARVAQIAALRPDIVVVLGDVMEGDANDGDTRAIVAVLRRLSAPLGVWAVTGNHEVYAGLDESVRLLADAGLGVLRDRSVDLRPGLVLAGVDDLTARRDRGQGDPVARALAGRPPGATILLSHTPWEADVAARAGVGLMLAAHTHGGQIWPFGYFVRGRYPLMAGRYDVDGMPVIVCRGTGTWGPRMRLWRPSELLRITLRVP